MRPHNSKMILELLFFLLVMMLVSSFALVNSYANGISPEHGKYEIYGIRDSGPGSGSTGCPTGYTVTGVLEDECTGKGTVTKTCPKNFSPYEDKCTGDSKNCRELQDSGYRVEFGPFGQLGTGFCIGPQIDQVQCPSGFRKLPDYPELCIGPRNF